MTVSAQTPINRSTGNGVTTVFPYDFKILAAADIQVTVDGVAKTLNVDYTVSGVGNDAGGNVTMTVAPANLTSVVRRRNMGLVRTTDYQDQGELPAATLDADIDAAVLMIQQVDEQIGRALTLPAGVVGVSAELPEPAAFTLLGWNDDGTAIENYPPLSAGGSDAALVTYDPAGAGAVPMSVRTKLRESVSVKDFGAVGDGVTDDTVAIQAAINTGAGTVDFLDETYAISGPLYLDGGQRLVGKGSAKTIILKTTTTVGSGSNLARGGTVTDSYDKNAILILRHTDNSYNYSTTLEGIQLKSNGYIVEYGIYAPRMTHAFFKDVYIMQCRYSFVTNDAWLNTFIKVIANSNSVDPEGVPGVAASSYGWTNSYGFWWKDDGTGSATGTSLNAIDCWARDCSYGWHLYGLQYSTLNSCAADNISKMPYRLHLSKLTLNGCGTENACISGGGAYSIESCRVTMNVCQSQTINGHTAGSTANLLISDSTVVLNGCQFDNFDTAGTSNNLTIQSGSKVINNGSTFPTNGNSYISYSGGSQYINNAAVPPYVATSDGLRYTKGRARDNQVQEKTAKAVLSAGTVIATLTCNGGGGVETAAVRFKITWYDTAFASCVGVSNVEVVCYQDSSGTNYRQAINTSVNIGAGNGYTTAPTYSIARSGNVWSVTMTPAHGDVTCNTITAEVEAISGFTVALT